MNYVWGTVGWIWSKKGFLGLCLISAVLFFAWMFPFSDLSDMVTSKVAQATGNQVYLQARAIDLNFRPLPALAATDVSLETMALPPLEAKWLQIAPGWFNILFNLWTFKKAAGGDPEASSKLMTQLSGSVSASGILGGDISLSVSPGTAGESKRERSKVALAMSDIKLADVRRWAELPIEVQGTANASTTMMVTPGFLDQPEGDIEVQISSFKLPAGTVDTPMGPLNTPALTLSNVLLKGRLVNGSLILEEGTFGAAKDPINGRLKGQVALRLQPTAPGVQPQFGAYNLTVDLNTSKQIDQDKSMAIAFLLFDPAKTATANGSRYLFRATGTGFGMMAGPPSISRITSF